LKIIFLSNFAGSPYHGMVYGQYYLAREWVKKGHEVCIVSASFAHTRFKQPEQTGKIQEEYIDGIRYIWLPTPEYNPKSSIGRIKSIIIYTLRCRFMKLPVSNADVVICSSHHPFPIYTAHRLARKFKAKLVFEVRDLWPLTLIELGNVSKQNPFIVLMQRAEDYAYKHADKVISVLPSAKDYMVGRGMEPEKFLYIPNGADLSTELNAKGLPQNYVETLELIKANGKFIIGYVGKIGLSNALHTLVEASALINDNDIVVVIIGSGAFITDLKILIKKLEVSEKFYFLDQIEKDQVFSFLQYIDVAYVGALKSPLYRFGMSLTKLNDYMLASKPIIYAVEAPSNIIELSGSGISCEAENPEALSQAIQKLKNLSVEDRKKMGTLGREWIIKNHDYKILADRFLDNVIKTNDQ